MKRRRLKSSVADGQGLTFVGANGRLTDISPPGTQLLLLLMPAPPSNAMQKHKSTQIQNTRLSVFLRIQVKGGYLAGALFGVWGSWGPQMAILSQNCPELPPKRPNINSNRKGVLMAQSTDVKAANLLCCSVRAGWISIFNKGGGLGECCSCFSSTIF